MLTRRPVPQLGRVRRWGSVLARTALWAELAVFALPARAAPGPTPGEVAEAIAERRARVAELELIKEAAEELGLRVWLFGGTAAGFAHYVRWDLAREAGDARYRRSFFDYDFTNIYRSTQDADLVVDGTPEQATQLEDLIKRKMSFLQGSKDHWEVRLLRQARLAGAQVKLPLLGNPDFLEQNTDSNSTGMIEITDPPRGEGVVRDLRDWESPEPFFLQDITAGRLHYYLSPTHRQTSRYRSGDNPELFSVIRYLVKAFQYDLAIEGEDRRTIEAIIHAFDPKRDSERLSPWAKGWLERYGPNLIRHSVNIERAWDTLEELGLRKKLISLSNAWEEGSLGWWLSREPLRSAPVGTGKGKTAAELGIEVVAHETGSFLAYESITRDTTLRPNVLVSRPGQRGENAAYGPGFYTRRGRVGARQTGLTIRFKMDPKARRGTDFTLAEGDFVVVKNRAALQVIPESLEASLLQYFQLFQEGAVDPTDRGAWIKLERRLMLRPPGPGELEQILSLVDQAIDTKFVPQRYLVGNIWHTSTSQHFPALLNAWFNFPLSFEHPEVVQAVIDRGDFDPYDLICGVLSQPQWASHPEFVRQLIGRSEKVNDLLFACVFTKEAWTAHPELVLAVLEDGQLSQERPPHGGMEEGIGSARGILSGPIWRDHPECLKALDRLVARARKDRLSSPEARSVALAEAGYAVVNDRPEEWISQLRQLTVLQDRLSGGRYAYRAISDYTPLRGSFYSHQEAVVSFAALYARRLAPAMAGLTPGDDEARLEERVRRLAERTSLSYGGWPHRTAQELQEERRSVLDEARTRARQMLEERAQAVQAVAEALLRKEQGISGKVFRRIVDQAPPEPGWGEMAETLREVAGEREGNPSASGCR